MQIRTVLAGAVFVGAAVLGGTAIPAAADCYTGCSTPTTGVAQTTPIPPGAAPTPHNAPLAFTGADIEELALLGLAGIGIGTVLIRKRKHVS